MSKFDSKRAERVVAALVRRGYVLDELESLCDTEEDLIALHRGILKTEAKGVKEEIAAEDDEEEEEPVDDFRLPASEAAALFEEEKQGDVRESKERFQGEAAVDPNTGEPVASFDDFMKSLDEGMREPENLDGIPEDER